MNASTRDDVWIGIDVGTQSVKAIAVTGSGEILASASNPLASQRNGREHTQDPWAWWEAVCVCCERLCAAIDPGAIQGMAIDATSGTILLTDERLHPATDALMYDDSRALRENDEVNAAGATLWGELGYRMQPSWALPKLLWLARTLPASRLKTLRLTHQNDFIHQQLTGARTATDWSHSLKTGYDLIRLRWPLEILAQLHLEANLFPDVVAPGTVIGHVSGEAAARTHLPIGLPLYAGMTDGCAAQIASGTVTVGSWNSVIGTTLVIKGVTAERLRDPLGIVYSHRSREGSWLPGGASSTGAGALTKLLADADLGSLSEQSAKRGPTDLVCYPLTSRGERFPFQAAEAEGFTLGTPRDEVEQYRAILQGVCYIERLSFDYLEMLGASLDGSFTISGGAVRSALWNTLRATILERPLTIPKVTESALGMAILAAASSSTLADAAQRMVRQGTVVEPAWDFASLYGEGYRTLLRQLEQRGWLPPAIANFAIGKIDRGNGAGS